MALGFCSALLLIPSCALSVRNSSHIHSAPRAYCAWCEVKSNIKRDWIHKQPGGITIAFLRCASASKLIYGAEKQDFEAEGWWSLRWIYACLGGAKVFNLRLARRLDLHFVRARTCRYVCVSVRACARVRARTGFCFFALNLSQCQSQCACRLAQR